MSDKPVPTLPPGILTQEQIDKVSGGFCTAAEWQQILNDLQQSYESVVGFTSYVIERVVTATKT